MCAVPSVVEWARMEVSTGLMQGLQPKVMRRGRPSRCRTRAQCQPLLTVTVEEGELEDANDDDNDTGYAGEYVPVGKQDGADAADDCAQGHEYE